MLSGESAARNATSALAVGRRGRPQAQRAAVAQDHVPTRDAPRACVTRRRRRRTSRPRRRARRPSRAAAGRRRAGCGGRRRSCRSRRARPRRRSRAPGLPATAIGVAVDAARGEQPPRLLEVPVAVVAVLADVDHADAAPSRCSADGALRARGAPTASRRRRPACARAADPLRSCSPSQRARTRRRRAIGERSRRMLRKTRSRVCVETPWPPPQRTDKLAEVVEAGTAIARGLDLDETLQTIVEAAARVTRRDLLRARRARARPAHQPLHHDRAERRGARAAREPADRAAASSAC